jgi:hypothetical protein
MDNTQTESEKTPKDNTQIVSWEDFINNPNTTMGCL